MEKSENIGAGDLDIAALHSEPDPEDVVLSTDEAVAKMKAASALNIPSSGLLPKIPDRKKATEQVKKPPSGASSRPPAQPRADTSAGPAESVPLASTDTEAVVGKAPVGKPREEKRGKEGVVSPEELARGVSAERIKQEELLTEFEQSYFKSPAEELRAAVAVITKLRASLERQADISKQANRKSAASKEYKALGTLLKEFTKDFDAGKNVNILDIKSRLRASFGNEMSQPWAEPMSSDAAREMMNLERRSRGKLIEEFEGAADWNKDKGADLIKALKDSLEVHMQFGLRGGFKGGPHSIFNEVGEEVRNKLDLLAAAAPVLPSKEEFIARLRAITGIRKEETTEAVRPLVGTSTALMRREGGAVVGGVSGLLPNPDAAHAEQLLSAEEFDVDAAISISGFLTFKHRRETATGVTVNTGDREAMKECFGAFASREKVSNELFTLYRDRWSEVIGVQLSADSAAALRASVEKLAVSDPKGFAEMQAITRGLTELPAEIKKLEEEIVAQEKKISSYSKRVLTEENLVYTLEEGKVVQKAVPPSENMGHRIARIKDKKHLLEIAEKTNRFFSGGGYVGEGLNLVIRRFGPKKFRARADEKVVAREEARNRGVKASGGFHHLATFGMGISTRQIRKEIATIAKDLETIGSLPEFTDKIKEKQERLDECKAKLFHESAIGKESIGMLQAQLKAIFTIASNRETTSFEQADKALAVLKRAQEAPLSEAVGKTDVLAGMSIPDVLSTLQAYRYIRLGGLISDAFDRTVGTGDNQVIILNNLLEQLIEQSSLRQKKAAVSRSELRRYIVEHLDRKIEELEAGGSEWADVQAASARILIEKQEAAIAEGR